MAKDITGLLGGVLTEENLDSLSKQAGVSPDQVKSVLGNALPSLLGGALGQAQNQETAQGFAGALKQHAADDVSDVKGFLKGVDVQDGEKIVGHLLGKDGQAVDEIAEKAGVRKMDVSKILALVAPLLLSLLGQETQSQQQQNAGLDVGSIMGGLLGGGLLGGSSGQAQSSNAGGGLLTGLLGGGSSSQQSSGSSGGGLLGGLLGGLFGGK